MIKLARSSFVFAAFTFVSRILGLLRDVLIASIFGVGVSSDAFLVAFRIPNFFRRLFAEGSFSQAFVPVLSQSKAQAKLGDTMFLANQIFLRLCLILLCLCLLVLIATPLVIGVFAPGFVAGGERWELATSMLRITFPYLLFISLTAFCAALLNVYNKFAIPAAAPIILNLCFIVACVVAYTSDDPQIKLLAWAVFIAGIIQFLFLFLFAYRQGFRLRLRWRVHPGISKVLGLMLPTLFSTSATQISLLVDTLLASFLTVGSVSWLYFADRLVGLPLGVCGVAIATVVLPSLAKYVSTGQRDDYRRTLLWALKIVFSIAVPAVVALLLLAEQIIITLFAYRSFTLTDVVATASALRAYSLGLLSFMLIKVLTNAFFAHKEAATPVKIALFATAVNICLSLAMIFALQHVGLALGTALGAICNSVLLFVFLSKRGYLRFTWFSILPSALPIILATGAMSYLLLLFGGDSEAWTQWLVDQRIKNLVIICGGGLLCYAGVFAAVMFLMRRFGYVFSR